MSNYAISLKRSTALAAALAFMAVLSVANFSSLLGGTAGAAQLQSRNLSLNSTLRGSQTTGASLSETNGSSTRHTFTFTAPTGGPVRSMQFDYCTTAIGTCTAPTGLVVNAGSSISTQTLEGSTVTNLYTINVGGSTASRLRITNATGNTVVATTTDTFVIAFDTITNPTNVGTFFVRINTYSDAAWVTSVDDGVVASSITEGIVITSRVVEALGFSVTADDAGVPAEGASCAPLTGSGAITLGNTPEGALSITQAYDEFSAFRLYTNSTNGTIVQYEGSTLTKGTDDINAIGATAVSSTVATEQFGLAVDANGGIFTDDTGGFGGAGQLTLNAQYDGGDGTITSGGTATFAFVADTKTTIATASQFVTCDTATVRYIGNISPVTPAGIYTTTIVYFAVPTF
jgi:hypothetical protein